MIKVEKVQVFNFEAAINGMRNPYDSWNKSDSQYDDNGKYIIGINDMSLMQRLFKAGTEHRKFMRQILVSMDITAPDFWWLQFDAYKVGITCNSTSKMHTLVKKPFEPQDFSIQDMWGYHCIAEQRRPIITKEMESTEEWKEVEEDYYVSNLGRLKHGDKLLSGSEHNDGYLFINIRGKQISIHRLVCKAFHADTYRDGLFVNHIDANKKNNMASNLEWVTQKENIEHARKLHLQPVPVKTYKGKLTKEQREEVFMLYESGVAKREIARRFNVTNTCINDMINGKHPFIERKDVYSDCFLPLINILNKLRDEYLAEPDPVKKKDLWRMILQMTPLSYNQTRTVTMNYEVIATMIRQRKGHKLVEWKGFIDAMLEELPYLKEIMGENGNE